jgi:hypothetical protein
VAAGGGGGSTKPRFQHSPVTPLRYRRTGVYLDTTSAQYPIPAPREASLSPMERALERAVATRLGGTAGVLLELELELVEEAEAPVVVGAWRAV